MSDERGYEGLEETPSRADVEPRYHTLKTWPEPFQAIVDGRKPFEWRKDDRGFMVGDVLHLVEWDPSEFELQKAAHAGHYVSAERLDEMARTGREAFRRVTYVLHGGRFGVPEGYVVMGLEPHGDDETGGEG